MKTSIEEERMSPVNSPRSLRLDSKRSPKGTGRTQSKNVTLDPQVLSELEKLPVGDELYSLDIISIYECKIESILLIDKILSSIHPTSSRREKSSTRGSNKKKVDEHTFALDHDSLKLALKLRLAISFINKN